MSTWNIKANNLSKEEINTLLGDAWLNIRLTEGEYWNPLEKFPSACEDNPELYITWLLSQPEYFQFICKEILNIEIYPTQGLVLQTLWNHKFPMLIASRGFSKSFTLALYAILRMILLPGRKIVITGAAFRQSKIIFEYMETIWNNAPLLRNMCGTGREQGPTHGTDMWTFRIGKSITKALPMGCLEPNSLVTTKSGIKKIIDLKKNAEKEYIWSNNTYKNIGYFYDSGISPSIRVKTKLGYEYCATPNHKMKIVRNDAIIWCRTDEIKIGDRILIDRTNRWHEGNIDSSIDEAYCLGLMLGDGNFTNKYYLRYTTIDKFFLDFLNKEIGVFRPENDNLHYQFNSIKKVSEWMSKWELEPVKSHQKILTNPILSASKEKMTACLQGLFDTDGTLQESTIKGGTTVNITYYTTSHELAKQVHYILLHYGIISTLRSRKRKSPRTGNPAKRCYEISIYGHNVKLFAEQINFRLPRKRDKLNNALKNKIRFNSLQDIVPGVNSWFKNNYKKLVKDNNPITYNKLSKIPNTLILPKNIKELCDINKYYDIVTEIKIEQNQPMYDINVPDGNEYCSNGFYSHNTGDKIRGQRAHDIISDEFASITREIFEVVVAGFAAVAANPIESLRREATKRLAEHLGVKLDRSVNLEDSKDNQIIISGTAYYDFNHFSEYWKLWHKFISSINDKSVKEQLKAGGKNLDGFNPKDYAIMRIPVDLIPKGFMDEAQIARSKATVLNDVFLREFGAVFAKDSNGFFKRSLIEACVASPQNAILDENRNAIIYYPALHGNLKKKYIIAVDPASEVDNFAIVVMELNPGYRKIVYVWTTNKKDFNERRTAGLTQETSYYAFAARKIRQLLKVFPCDHVSMDSQGGGYSVLEALHDKDKLLPGDELIWETIVPGEPKPSDGERGLHIVELINFADSTWTAEANHGLKKDLGDKTCLFPFVDAIEVAKAMADSDSLYDTIEDCIFEIEELKNELSIIILTRTPTGKDKWDTPDNKVPGSKKGDIRKDRYSALLMANMAARQCLYQKPVPEHNTEGGWADDEFDKRLNGPSFQGPDWLARSLNNLYD